MACNERGMALVSVILILTVLLTMAHILAEKAWQSIDQRAVAAEREQVFWAAQAGIEVARRQLAADYASSEGWQSLLTVATLQAYPAAPAWVTTINGLSVEIFLRDNPDGDGDAGHDNDLKVFVLARAQGRRGTAAMVESLCGFELTGPASPTLQPARRADGAGSDWSDQPVSTYGITD